MPYADCYEATTNAAGTATVKVKAATRELVEAITRIDVSCADTLNPNSKHNETAYLIWRTRKFTATNVTGAGTDTDVSDWTAISNFGNFGSTSWDSSGSVPDGGDDSEGQPTASGHWETKLLGYKDEGEYEIVGEGETPIYQTDEEGNTVYDEYGNPIVIGSSYSAGERKWVENLVPIFAKVWVPGYIPGPGSAPPVNTESEGDDANDIVDNKDVAPNMPPLAAQDEPYSLSLSDAAGPKYRKISLRGVPLSDDKPTEQNENGEPEEETYLDAFSGELHHSTSDVYSAIESSELPLMVRRDVTVEGWDLRNGLRPNERPDLPFGAGWRSNICSYVKFEGGNRALVVDEMGATQGFFKNKFNLWVIPSEENTDVKSAMNQFNAVWNNGDPSNGYMFNQIVLVKKHGTRCFYEMIPSLKAIMPSDRLTLLSNQINSTTFARLAKVVDRMGNELVYEYPHNYTLIPSQIYDPKRSSVVNTKRAGHCIHITQSLNLPLVPPFSPELFGLSRVTSVQSPDGNITTYSYAVQRDTVTFVPGRITNVSASVLTKVTRLDALGNTGRYVGYGYQTNVTYGTPLKVEGLAEFSGEDVLVTPHHIALELTRITDEAGLSHNFSRSAAPLRYYWKSIAGKWLCR
jgi:hypothetical protein